MQLSGMIVAVKKIMIIDEDKKFAAGIANALNSNGYEILVADNGRDAAEKAEEVNPDIILISIELSEVSTLKIIAKLKDSPELKRTPILAMTSTPLSSWNYPVGMSGIQGHLVKPFSPLDLIVRIEKELEKT